MEASVRRATWQRKFNQHTSYHPSTSSSVSESSGTPYSTDTPSPGNSIPDSVHGAPKDIPPHGRKWWLHVQPLDLGQRLNALESELAALSSGTGLNNISEEFDAHSAMRSDFESLFQPSPKISLNTMKNNLDDRGLELKVVFSSDPKIPEKKQAKTQKELYPETESPWSAAEKTEPWWRSASKDELASFVAQKSVEHIENCDLPRPQKLASSTTGSSAGDICNPCPLKSSASLCNSGTKCNIHNGSCALHDLDGDGPFSENDQKTIEDQRQTQSGSEPTKSELLEALCRSQTRAREAEEAAQQAYTEKEHILSLFFRQASQLFAYRQWFQMLQLESFYLQLKSGDPPSGLSPCPIKGPALNKGGRQKRGSPRWWVVGKSAVAFTVGLGLTGAGLLLGWTLGWLFR